jgi:hypothetical protein
MDAEIVGWYHLRPFQESISECVCVCVCVCVLKKIAMAEWQVFTVHKSAMCFWDMFSLWKL